MPSEVEVLRDLAKLFWSGKPVPCPQHAGGTLTGSFVHTTFADHISLVCDRGKESLIIPQRPKQKEFLAQQVEGFVENMQRGDSILCYRCQSPLEVAQVENPNTGITDFTFTCIRCLSYGSWTGKPELAKIGE